MKAEPRRFINLRFSLKYVRPPIWWRIQIHGDVALGKLHRIIQTAMGWSDSHLHQFIVGESYYGVPSKDDLPDLNLKDERRTRLREILAKQKMTIVYEYDFGDGWEHEILLEKTLQPEPNVRYPRCIGGARACPPEDCGGVGGYANFLAAVRDPNHEEHDEYLDWIGGEFDPEEFELGEFDTALRRIR